MNPALASFLKRNASTLVLSIGLVAYVLTAGISGFCPACSAVTRFVGLSPSSDTASGATAPSWELRNLQGETVRSSELEGKVVVLGFWATWCPPCQKEVPTFIELQEQFGDKGIAVVGVSLDQGGPAQVASFVEKAGINYAVVMGDSEMIEAFGGIPSIPTTFIIDREGRIVEKHIGYVSKGRFEDSIEKLL